MENDEIRNRAIEYFKKQVIQAKCPEPGCTGYSAWQVGKPQRVRDRVNHSQKADEREADTVRYFVPLLCGECGKMIERYDEP